MYMCVRACMCACARECVFDCMYVYVFVCMSVFVCVCKFIFIQTSINQIICLIQAACKAQSLKEYVYKFCCRTDRSGLRGRGVRFVVTAFVEGMPISVYIRFKYEKRTQQHDLCIYTGLEISGYRIAKCKSLLG